jgi:hypothetical protein
MTALAARWPACTGDAGDQRYAGPDGTRAGASVRAGRGWPFPEGQRLTFRRVTGWGGALPPVPPVAFSPPSVTHTVPKSGAHGRIADGGNPKIRLERHPRWSAAFASTGSGGL